MHASSANATYGNWTPTSTYSKVLPEAAASTDATARQPKATNQTTTNSQIIGRAKPMCVLYQQHLPRWAGRARSNRYERGIYVTVCSLLIRTRFDTKDAQVHP